MLEEFLFICLLQRWFTFTLTNSKPSGLLHSFSFVFSQWKPKQQKQSCNQKSSRLCWVAEGGLEGHCVRACAAVMVLYVKDPRIT